MKRCAIAANSFRLMRLAGKATAFHLQKRFFDQREARLPELSSVFHPHLRAGGGVFSSLRYRAGRILTEIRAA